VTASHGGGMVAEPLIGHREFQRSLETAVYDAQEFARAQLRSTAFSAVSAIDFTLFQHVPFTNAA
jgi:hypothetical protein